MPSPGCGCRIEWTASEGDNVQREWRSGCPGRPSMMSCGRSGLLQLPAESFRDRKRRPAGSWMPFMARAGRILIPGRPLRPSLARHRCGPGRRRSCPPRRSHHAHGQGQSRACARPRRPGLNQPGPARKSGVPALYVESSRSSRSSWHARRAHPGGGGLSHRRRLRDWGRIARERLPGIEVEATGGMSLSNVRAYAEAGADFVSIGALTHSVTAADIAIEVKI